MERKLPATDDVARTGAPAPRFLSTRRDMLPTTSDTMRFKASIQDISTFTSALARDLCVYRLLIVFRAHRIAQFAWSARVGEAQRRTDMLHRHPRTGHPSVGVSALVASCAQNTI
jgi:hypothetical protein